MGAGPSRSGYAVPEAVYVDFDVIRSAPPLLNRSGACDVLCYHTAHYDWKLAHELGKDEARWPYDPSMVAEARQSYDAVYAALDDIREVNDAGIRALMLAHRWGGAAFHNAGWNARHMDGVDHALPVLPGERDRPSLHPRPGGRPRDLSRLGAPGQ